jgi:hypothetical protein
MQANCQSRALINMARFLGLFYLGWSCLIDWAKCLRQKRTCTGRYWHLTDKQTASIFVAYWTNNGQMSAQGLNG